MVVQNRLERLQNDKTLIVRLQLWQTTTLAPMPASH